MIHVVHIIPALSFGGAERIIVDIINNSDPKNFKFSIIVFGTNNHLKKEIINQSAKVITVNKRGKISLHLFKDISKKLKELKPDIVHTHLFGADFWGRVAAKKLGLPVITTEHNFNDSEGVLKNLIKNILHNKTDVYTACSIAVKNYAIKKYSILADKIKVIDCAIDLNKFKKIPLAVFNDQSLKFLMLGRLSKQKGHKIALQALSKINKDKWSLTIVGNGELLDSLKKLVKKLNIINNVKFLPASSKVSEVLSQHQILLFPSLWEGSGIATREAMCAGRVVIASNVGGIPEYMEDSLSGYLVEPNSVDALYHKIQWCFDNPNKLKQTAKNAKQFAIDNFAVEIMVKKYEKLYKSLIR